MSDLFKEAKEAAESKPAAKKDKLIKVKTLVELPFYKGKRIPKGRVIEVLESNFNAKLMEKI